MVGTDPIYSHVLVLVLVLILILVSDLDLEEAVAFRVEARGTNNFTASPRIKVVHTL